MNISRTRQIKTVDYQKPIIRRTAIGTKPLHHFDQTATPKQDYVSLKDDSFAGGDFTVWADIPDKNSDGSPVLVDQRDELDMTPRSPWKYGGIAGGVGALAGAGAGALIANANAVHPGLGAAVGALAVGGLAGAAGAYHVYGEKTKLVWDQHNIVDHKMNGYRELVGPGKSGDETGYFHRYIADVESTKIGEYKTPRVLRFKGKDPTLNGPPKPLKETPQKDIPKEPSKDLDVTVTFEKAKLQSRYLGSIPSDYWSHSGFGGGYTSCGPGGCDDGSSTVHRDTPVYEPNSAPRVDTRTERIQASPYSIPLFATGGLAAGGALGYGLGLLTAHFTGIDPTIAGVVGASAVGVATSVGAGMYAANDAVRLEWREYSIDEKKLVGYTEYVTPHYEQECETYTDSEGESHTECETVQNGWDHSFSPDVRAWSVGSYIGPKVVHYQKGKDGGLAPVAENQSIEPCDKPKASDKTQKG